MKLPENVSIKGPDRVSLKTPDRISFKGQKSFRESKKSNRISTARKEGNNDIYDEPTPKMSIITRASSENNPEKMIRNVRSDIEELKNKIKGRLAAGNGFMKLNAFH